MRDETPIEELDLSVRSYNCLRRAGIHTVGDLINMDSTELMSVRNLSKKCYEEIAKIMNSNFGTNFIAYDDDSLINQKKEESIC